MADIAENLKQQALVLLDEALEEPTVPYWTFTDHEGLLPTLSRVTAETASAETTPGDPTSTIAAHCEHLRFSAGVWSDWLRGSREPVDWSASWTVSQIGESAWQQLLSNLRTAFVVARKSVSSCDATTPESVGGILSVAAHTAYHIGAIRQKLP